jgi:alkane 1-monooxygenase
LTAWCVYIAAIGQLSTVSFIGLALSLGIVNGVLGFTIAHELIHHFKKIDLTCGYMLLLQNNYMHYGIEHVWGHHVYACTPDDPHTARIDESVYAFLPRTIIATYKNAWKIEKSRLSRTFNVNISRRNRMVVFGILQIFLMIAILVLIGLKGFLFFVLQNIVAITLLHIINYIQHYGLLRRKKSNGNYERLDAHHAWSTDRHNKTVDLFHLENHAHHHMHPNLSFEKLTPTAESPKHPSGYSFMVLLSLVPPLWFKIMNKKVPSHLFK